MSTTVLLGSTVRPQMLGNGEKTFVKSMLHHIPFTQHSLPAVLYLAL